MKGCTQADIARELDVSQAAVCLAIGNARSARRKRLSNETCLKIRAKALEMGYKPHQTAQVLRTGRTTSITIINFGGFTEITTQRTFEIGRLAHEAGFNFDVIDAYWYHDDLERMLERILDARPLAVIIAGAIQPNFPTEKLIRAGIHVVGVGVPVQGCPWVRYDARAAIREITSAMIAAGRRRLTLIVRNYDDSFPSWQFQERRQGFLDAIAEAGVQPREYQAAETDFGFSRQSSVVDAIIAAATPESSSLRDFDSVTELAERLMSSGAPPDMLVCTNDFYAIGAMAVCHRKGARIPDDVGISGFDDVLFSTHATVPLTTVKQPTMEMCATALKIIKGKLRRPAALSLQEEEHVFPCEIIWRESTPRSLR